MLGIDGKALEDSGSTDEAVFDGADAAPVDEAVIPPTVVFIASRMRRMVALIDFLPLTSFLQHFTGSASPSYLYTMVIDGAS